MRKASIKRTCEICGKSFTVPPSYLNQQYSGGRFCSMSCYGQWRKGKAFTHPHPEMTTSEIAAKYMGGMTLDQIANLYGVTKQAIWYRLQQAGIPRRSPDSAHILQLPEVKEAARRKNRQRTGEKNHNYKALPVPDIIKQYRNGDSTSTIAHRYGVTGTTIAKRLRAAGITLRRRGFSRYRRCPDGHLVQSRWEYEVDRWLQKHGIEHEVQPLCPWRFKGRARQLADFRVGDTYIEVWGVVGNEKYDRRRQEKLAKYREGGIRLIEVFPHHILDGDYSPLEALL